MDEAYRAYGRFAIKFISGGLDPAVVVGDVVVRVDTVLGIVAFPLLAVDEQSRIIFVGPKMGRNF
jgi:hypothetical protein